MTTTVAGRHTLALNEVERTVLLTILQSALRTAEVEENRTEAAEAKSVVHAHRLAVESLLRKTQAAD